MFRKVSGLALAICALGGGLTVAEPAIADGWWGRGSIKDRVPVPAPAPIPDHAARWYLRADLGLGFASASPSESGIVYGRFYDRGPDTSQPSGSLSSWSEDDTETTFNYGGGFGYYWSPSFRTDMTLEGRSQRDLKIRGTYLYEQEFYDEGTGDWIPNNTFVSGDTSDTAKLDSGLFLLNAYFDFVRSGPLTPYVGAGVGFSVNKLQRSFANEEELCWDCAYLDGSSARGSTYDVTFAAAAMAGLSYSISPVTMLDVNYRYLYVGGSDIDLNIDGVKSNFSTGDTHEHQIRVGLRWNIQ